MAFAPQSAHPLDHVVLPTASLAAARSRLGALGFTVAPEGVHPFGTANACVYIADGTFLEPLAVAEAGLAERAIKAGNVFVARDRSFRRFCGEEGFSGLVFATPNADADHARFVAAYVSGGDQLSFSRPFADASGAVDTASFKLAFAEVERSPGAFFFACERVNAPKVDRSALQHHANGVRRILSVHATAPSVEPYRQPLSTIAAAEFSPETASLALPNATLHLSSQADFAHRFGLAAPAGEGLRLSAIVFGISDRAATAAALKSGGIAFETRGDRLVVPMQPGQGAILAFEEFS